MGTVTPDGEALVPVEPPAAEGPGYTELKGSQIYYVRHAANGPIRGKVLLAGPFAMERQNAYITWVRWARKLASHGFETLHFDYRGTAESTGNFEDMNLSDWIDDIHAMTTFLGQDNDSVPVVLCGLRVGALLAAEAFRRGLGDALLMWAPPHGGSKALVEVLRRRLATDYMEGTGGKRKTRKEYVADMESGRNIMVEGYSWTRRLWTDAGQIDLALPGPDEKRPWRVVAINGKPPRSVPAEHAHNVRIQRPPFWNHTPYVLADVDDLFKTSLEFLNESFERPSETS